MGDSHLRHLCWAAPWIAGLVLAGCNRAPEAAEMPPPTVIVAKPLVQDVVEYYEFTGTTEAVDFVEVRARVSGYLEDQKFEPSTRVESGTLLFVIEPEPYEIAVQAAEAEVAQVQAALDLANLRRDRIVEAFANDAASNIEMEESKATSREAAAQLAAAQARLSDAQLNLGYTQVSAPITGMVSRELVDVGQLVGVSEPTLLTTVARMDPIYAYFDLSERIVLTALERRQMSMGEGESGDRRERPFEIARASDPIGTFPFRGEFDYVDNRVDERTGTIRVRGVIPNEDGNLFPGLFVRARAPKDWIRNAVLIAENAIGTALQDRYVMTVGSDGIAKRQPVTLGPRLGGYIVILEGLTGDQQYVLEGIQKTVNGRPVQATMAKPEQLPEPPEPPTLLPPDWESAEAADPPADPPADAPDAGA